VPGFLEPETANPFVVGPCKFHGHPRRAFDGKHSKALRRQSDRHDALRQETEGVGDIISPLAINHHLGIPIDGKFERSKVQDDQRSVIAMAIRHHVGWNSGYGGIRDFIQNRRNAQPFRLARNISCASPLAILRKHGKFLRKLNMKPPNGSRPY
jgi:hypothetical protein